MNRGAVISFKLGEEIRYDYILKILSKEDEDEEVLQAAVQITSQVILNMITMHGSMK